VLVGAALPLESLVGAFRGTPLREMDGGIEQNPAYGTA